MAEPDTEEEWLDRAAARTFKHLRQEVRAAEVLLRLEGRALSAGPPTEAELDRVFAVERDAKSGESARHAVGSLEQVSHSEAVVQMSVTLPVALTRRLELNVAAQAVSAIGSSPAQLLGRTTVSLRLTEDVARFFREVEALHERSGLEGRLIPFLVGALFHAWQGVLGTSDKWESIYRRDGYVCSSPVCESQDVTLHHLEHRGDGGGDEADNLTSLCARCHLEGEHGGRLKVHGPASRMTWEIGGSARPVMVVCGRELSRGRGADAMAA